MLAYQVVLWLLIARTTSALRVRAVNNSTSTITAAPTSTDYSTCAATGTDAIYSGYSTDLALQCYCVNVFNSWVSTTQQGTHTMTRLQPSGITTQTIVTDGTTETTSFQYVTTEVFTVTGNDAGADGFNWYGTAEPPCCSSCTIAAQTVQLYYWPTPAIPSQATSFVSNGYTFVSPSVYIGFTSLYAYDFCSTVGQIYSTTLEFGPNELSSIGSPTPVTVTTTDTVSNPNATPIIDTTETTTYTVSVGGPASAINYRDLGQNCSTISGYTYLASVPLALDFVTYDPCHPTILLPEKVKTLDPAWATCVDNLIGGFYDPPYSLTALKGAIQPFSSSSTTSTSTSATAIPVSQPTSTAAPASTPSSPVRDPTTTTTQSTPTVTPSSPVQDPTTVPEPTSTSPTTVSVTSNPTIPESPASSPSASTESSVPVVATSNPVASNPVASNPIGSNPTTATPATPVTTPLATGPVIIGSQTLLPGSSAITAPNGAIVSLSPTSSNVVIINPAGVTSTIPISSLSSAFPSATIILPSPAPSQSQATQPTLTPGNPVVISGTTYSLASTGSAVIVAGAAGTSTIPLSSANAIISSAFATTAPEPSLVPGSAVTVGGTVFSLQSGASAVVVAGPGGTSTIPQSAAESLISSAAAGSGTIGSAIQSIGGLGSGTAGVGASASGYVQASVGARHTRNNGWRDGLILGVVVAICLGAFV